ncbi:hypothetical protein GUJ93_ZPchr0006g43869 [Zizania palustris]|uniref:Uncharacterized protein n=1 Tax=Zizania palustris TaxID=103762 RepID=A0A8J5W1K4_ZIZPA|nr:hypothetical protein GUJ93_ZPchr0006g43869 [Zizania palustris]
MPLIAAITHHGKSCRYHPKPPLSPWKIPPRDDIGWRHRGPTGKQGRSAAGQRQDGGGWWHGLRRRTMLAWVFESRGLGSEGGG